MQQAQLSSQKPKQSSNPKQHQVTILSASFSLGETPNDDRVIWQVELKNGDIYPIVWTVPEFSKFVGVKGLIPPALLAERLPTFVGKTDVTLIIEDFKEKPPPPPIGPA